VINANDTVTPNTWTYDNRLRTVTLATPATTTFTYDDVGNRETMEGSTDWTASGAGTAGFNGQYADDGTYGGRFTWLA